MNTQHYDLISIGGGSGGLAVAEKSAMLGARTAIIDPQRLGGKGVLGRRGCGLLFPDKQYLFDMGDRQFVENQVLWGVADDEIDV